jgi:translation initiation factor IF-3
VDKKLKEIKFRPRTEKHDLDFKTRHVREFLEKGHPVRLVVMFQGREMAHPEKGHEVLQRVLSVISDVGAVKKLPVLQGRDLSVTVVPK